MVSENPKSSPKGITLSVKLDVIKLSILVNKIQTLCMCRILGLGTSKIFPYKWMVTASLLFAVSAYDRFHTNTVLSDEGQPVISPGPTCSLLCLPDTTFQPYSTPSQNFHASCQNYVTFLFLDPKLCHKRCHTKISNSRYLQSKYVWQQRRERV